VHQFVMVSSGLVDKTGLFQPFYELVRCHGVSIRTMRIEVKLKAYALYASNPNEGAKTFRSSLPHLDSVNRFYPLFSTEKRVYNKTQKFVQSVSNSPQYLYIIQTTRPMMIFPLSSLEIRKSG
jgi:hypothetical protein